MELLSQKDHMIIEVMRKLFSSKVKIKNAWNQVALPLARPILMTGTSKQIKWRLIPKQIE